MAEEIAARTVNKERARSGESKEASRTSTEDISSGVAEGFGRTVDGAPEPSINSMPRRDGEVLRAARRCRRRNSSEHWMPESELQRFRLRPELAPGDPEPPNRNLGAG